MFHHYRLLHVLQRGSHVCHRNIFTHEYSSVCHTLNLKTQQNLPLNPLSEGKEE